MRGLFFYLYLIMDVYSRKIVGWEVYAEESAEHAASVFRKTHLREGVGAAGLVLHSDNGPLKGHPGFPQKPFDTLDEARAWMAKLAPWYNDEHHHRALKFVTPAQRHRGEDTPLLAQRDALYQAARNQQPERWSGTTRNWTPPSTVFLNPGKPPSKRVRPDAVPE